MSKRVTKELSIERLDSIARQLIDELDVRWTTDFKRGELVSVTELATLIWQKL